jgi:hypothetical protein
MKILTIRRDRQEAATKLKGHYATPSHADQILDRDTTVIAPDGSPTAVFLTQRIDSDLHRLAYAMWSVVGEIPRKRAMAVGSPSLPALRKDGSLSKRVGVPSPVVRILEESGVRYGILGSLGATAKHPCHKTALTRRQPELIEGNEPLIKRVNELYAQYVPTSYVIQQTEVEKRRRAGGFGTQCSRRSTSLKNLRTAYHSDRNLPGVMTVILPMGNFSGGELVFPRWRIAIAYRPGDLLLFDEGQLHGNLPFKGQRLSAAFYCARGIADCHDGTR